MSYTDAVGRKPANRERINITLPLGMPEFLSKIAGTQGRDRSALLEEAAKAYLATLGLEVPKASRRPRKPAK